MLTLEKKLERVTRAAEHIAYERLIRGAYVSLESEGKDGKSRGCSVGCDLIDILGPDEALRQDTNAHEVVADYYGIPSWVEFVRDAVFENYGSERIAATWHLDLAKALPVNKDFEPYRRTIIIKILKKAKSRSLTAKYMTRDQINHWKPIFETLISTFESMIHGKIDTKRMDDVAKLVGDLDLERDWYSVSRIHTLLGEAISCFRRRHDHLRDSVSDVAYAYIDYTSPSLTTETWHDIASIVLATFKKDL